MGRFLERLSERTCLRDLVFVKFQILKGTMTSFTCYVLLQQREKYKLESPQKYHYLNQTNCYKLDAIDDAAEYLATKRAMDVVGISEEDQEAIFRVVAAILHLGNLELAKGEEADSSVVKDEKSRYHLNTTAELLRCDVKTSENALIKRVMVTPEEVITRPLDPGAATINRDALAKTIYSRLFDWLVDMINVSIGQDPQSKSIIGVLDIYGFESFKFNSVFSGTIAGARQALHSDVPSIALSYDWNGARCRVYAFQ